MQRLLGRGWRRCTDRRKFGDIGLLGRAGRSPGVLKQKSRYAECTCKAKATINERRVITIPAAIRQAFGLRANDEVIIEQTERGILLRPAVSVPSRSTPRSASGEFASDEATSASCYRSVPACASSWTRTCCSRRATSAATSRD